MKMYIDKISKLLVWVIIIVFASGCTKFLDEQDHSNFTAENYFTNPVQAESSVNSIYASLRTYL